MTITLFQYVSYRDNLDKLFHLFIVIFALNTKKNVTRSIYDMVYFVSFTIDMLLSWFYILQITMYEQMKFDT